VTCARESAHVSWLVTSRNVYFLFLGIIHPNKRASVSVCEREGVRECECLYIPRRRQEKTRTRVDFETTSVHHSAIGEEGGQSEERG
jgi:hypothetical protein